jgi:hypothetical protein
MKVLKRRCGITIEAQPISGQTCPIEPADGATAIGKRKWQWRSAQEPRTNGSQRDTPVIPATLMKSTILASPLTKVRLRDRLVAIKLPRDSSPGGKMRQTKPFIVEIKQSRKLKPNASKPSIWGKLDLSSMEDGIPPADPSIAPATAEIGDRL